MTHDAGDRSSRPAATRVRLRSMAVVRALLRASPASVAIATVALFSGLVALMLSRQDWDPSLFIVCGDKFCHRNELPGVVTVVQDSGGYDGQFYFRLALNPFTSTQDELGIRLDVPPYRQQRILYPLLVYVVSFAGTPEIAVWAMIGVNLAALGWLAYLAARHARALALPTALGLVLAVFPGFLMTLTRDLTDLVASALVFASILGCLERRTLRAGVLFTLAVLARETSLLAMGVFLAHELVRFRATGNRDVLRRAVRSLVPGIAVFALWQTVLLIVWGYVPVLAGQTGIGLPFVGLVAAATAPPASGRWENHAIGATFAAVLLASVLIGFVTPRRKEPLVRYGLVAYVVLAACMTEVVYREEWSSVRTLGELVIFGWMTVLASSSRFAVALFAVAMPLACLFVVSQLL